MNKIYQKAARGEWVSTTDLATLVRGALKRAFPTVKFSVKSRRGSISVAYTDGPSRESVRAITGQFVTAGFDGTIDLAFSSSLWLYSDGSASHAYSSGTDGSNGCYPETIGSPERPDAVLCSLVAATYINVLRDVSAGLGERALASLKEKHPQIADTSLHHRELLGKAFFRVNNDRWVEELRTWVSCAVSEEAERIADEEFAA